MAIESPDSPRKLTVTFTGDDVEAFRDLIQDAEADELSYANKEFAGEIRKELDIPKHYTIESYW